MHGTTANRRTKGRVTCPSPSRIISCIAVVFLLAMAVPASAGLVSDFTSNITTGSAPLTVQFTDTSTGSSTGWAWYFGDEKYNASWTLVNLSAEWSARAYQDSVVMADGSIVLTGGNDGLNLGNLAHYMNDVWRSTDNGKTWTQMTAGASWPVREGHTSEAMPDGSIVLMGGGGFSGIDLFTRNDVWRSTNNGATWTPVNTTPGWSLKYLASSVLMPDSSIVLMGGYTDRNDTWQSTDNGEIWTRKTTGANWSGRYAFTCEAMTDGSIVLMGGHILPQEGQPCTLNDVWRSTDNGVTWTLVNANAGWPHRDSATSVLMPDGSIILMSGQDGTPVWRDGYGIIYPGLNDVWRSTDNGVTWMQLSADAGWLKRYGSTSVVMPDGSIVLMGGWVDGVVMKNDVWRFQTAGSSAKNPVHTYTEPGIYSVALQAYNANGYDSTRKTAYITVTPAPVADFTGTPTTGTAPLMVQFNDTSDGLGINAWNWNFGDMTWYNTSTYSSRNASHSYANVGTYTVSLTVSNASGSSTKTRVGYIRAIRGSEIGVFRPSTHLFYEDYNGNGRWDGALIDRSYNFGITGDIPITGDWNNNGITEIGVFRPSTHLFYEDYNGNGAWNGAVTDRSYYFGITGDIPITGDWNNNGITEIGVFRPSTHLFYEDYNGNGAWNGAVTDRSYNFGITGDIPITGDWNDNGRTEIGVFRPSTHLFYEDYNGNGLWNGAVTDRLYDFGITGDTPVTGTWT